MKKGALYARAHILQVIRSYFTERGFLEVETPLCIPANAPEEQIEPIHTTLPHWQLQTSPEICMKRLLCRGYPRIFQISHCWRAEERGSRHLTEFTMLEWYRTDAGYTDLMDDCRTLLQTVANSCIPNKKFRYKGNEIDPNGEWLNICVKEAFLRFANADPLLCLKNSSFDLLLTDFVEPALAKFNVPVIMTDYPSELATLAKVKPADSLYAERFELYLAGLELANGFSELNNPDEQRRRFVDTNRIRKEHGGQPLPLPEKFLAELDLMPEAAGIALGVDRLVMLTIGADSIDQVVAFTPESL